MLPKSPLGQALTYARNQWPTLGRYLGDALFSIDNNVAERAVRPLAVGRKNWLFIGGDAGLPTASVMMSLCGQCQTPRPQPVGLPHRCADTDVGQTHRPHATPARRLGQTNAIANRSAEPTPLHRTLTIYPPDKTSSGLIGRILSDDPLPLRIGAVMLPEPFDRVIRRALARDQQGRYPTTDAMREDLLKG